MARMSDIRDWVENYTDTLLQLYEMTDPKLGADGEVGKLETARKAIEVFWFLHGKLLVWAQAHLTGHAILFENPQLVSFLEQKLGEEITEDSHVLEQLGLQYVFNPPDDEDADLNRVYRWLNEFAGISDEDFKGTNDDYVLLKATVFRSLINELLMSRSADNSYWRFELQHALRALNEGEIDGLVKPCPGKRQGLPYSLKMWKLEALRQVRFRVGRGMKKYKALEEVGDGIGQSVETLRSWEKELDRRPDFSEDLYCSELAGRFRSDLKERRFRDIPDYEELGFHRGIYSVEFAQYLLPIIEKRTFEEIKSKILEYRQKKTGG